MDMKEEEIKNKLQKQKRELRAMLERFAEEDTRPEGDWDTEFPSFDGGAIEEAADEVEEYDTLRSIEHTLELKLKKTNEALKRIEKGTFGNCLDCGKKIKKERLGLAPEAEKCEECN